MEAFEEIALRNFEEWMVIHLNMFFPNQCEALGDSDVREAIQYGIEQAESYDIVTECDVCKYIDLMFALGRDFDTDPELPWALEILYDETLEDGSERIDRLCRAAITYLDRQG